MTPPWRAFRLLLALHLLELRAGVLAVVLGGAALPVALEVALRASGIIQTAAQRALVAGSSGVLAVMGVALLALPGAVARLRAGGQVGYFAALPVGRAPFLASLLAAYGLAALPGAILAPLVAARLFALPLSVNPLVALVFALTAATLLGIGLIVGFAAGGERGAGTVGSLLYLCLLAGPPLLLIPQGLPRAITTVGTLLPSAVASNAATMLLRGSFTGVPLDLFFLLTYAVVVFAAADRVVPWHLGRRRNLLAPGGN